MQLVGYSGGHRVFLDFPILRLDAALIVDVYGFVIRLECYRTHVHPIKDSTNGQLYGILIAKVMDNSIDWQTRGNSATQSYRGFVRLRRNIQPVAWCKDPYGAFAIGHFSFAEEIP